LKFLKNRNNPEAFEPVPEAESAVTAPVAKPAASTGGIEAYSVKVNGQVYNVEVGPSGELSSVAPVASAASPTPVASNAEDISAPLAGSIFKINVKPGNQVSEGDVLIVLEAMKMETEIRAARNGVIQELHVKEGDSVSVGSPILSLA
ncbi:MAG: biotin/lipoyl-containing protein, partial [Photobacterium frigidiphilum]|uniref:biotin/lipoyl-containing protein n=1 Tax=Photobacterium frigidiphilum TaxID=264736 RepID=UPI003002F768